MFPILDATIKRREMLRVGGVSALGLSLPSLLRMEAFAKEQGSGAATLGRAKNVLFLWLQGGPPQHETFDPKPNAPAEIRGEFKPISTNVPGISFCELLPRTSRIADQLAVIRSVSTANDLHDASGYWILTGEKYVGRESRQISPTDWPYFGSIVKMLKPSDELPGLSSVWLPDVMRLNDNVTPAGQTGGFLGKRWDPERIICDPSSPNFSIEGMSLPEDVPPLRFNRRRSLLDQVEDHLRKVERNPNFSLHDKQAEEAFALLGSGKARKAFDLNAEPESVRSRYGPGKWAPCLMLGRRLIEAGARLVHVNWIREGGDTAVDNPMWDTHAQNSDRLQNVLCPMFDVGFTALIEDMRERGLLDETLVVAIGEFGRTPKINKNGGRDHWGHVFSCVLAGAGIQTAQVYGSSDRLGAYPHTNKVEPQDLVATIFHLLGIGHDAFFRDQTDRPIRVTRGEPLWRVIGSGPAVKERVAAGGELRFVPAYSDALLLNTDFRETPALQPVGNSRTRGWQAEPLVGESSTGFGVWADANRVRLGSRGAGAPKGAKAVVAQEMRNPRAGRFTLTAKVKGGGGSAEILEKRLASGDLSARLVLYGYDDGTKKDVRKIREFASVPLTPRFGESGEVVLSHRLRSQDDGAFELSRGVGAMIVVEAASSATDSKGDAWIEVESLEVKFDARPRDETVTV